MSSGRDEKQNVEMPSRSLLLNVLMEKKKDSNRRDRETLKSLIQSPPFAGLTRAPSHKHGIEEVWYDSTGLLVVDPQKSANLLAQVSLAFTQSLLA